MPMDDVIINFVCLDGVMGILKTAIVDGEYYFSYTDCDGSISALNSALTDETPIIAGYLPLSSESDDSAFVVMDEQGNILLSTVDSSLEPIYSEDNCQSIQTV